MNRNWVNRHRKLNYKTTEIMGKRIVEGRVTTTVGLEVLTLL